MVKIVTQIISMADEKALPLATKLLLEGEIVAFPTETVYGLGAIYDDADATNKIYVAKNRPKNNPLIVHLSKADSVKDLVNSVPDEFYRLSRAFPEAPLTYVLPYRKGGTIALRIPAHPFARALIDKVQAPIAAPSANLSGKPSSTQADHVLEDFDGKIPLIIDGGNTTYGIESTVINLLDDKCEILRPGALTKESIENVLGKKISYSSKKTNISPGVMYKHYSPKCQVYLVENIPPYDPNVMLLSYNKKAVAWATAFNCKNIFSLFRLADSKNYKAINILSDDDLLGDYPLVNRLKHVVE